MKLWKSLYFQVLAGIVAGVLLGCYFPATAVKMEPLGTAFVSAVKMLIAPIIFTTIVTGIAAMGDLKKLGSVGWKSLLYFEAVTTIALIIGLVVGHVVQPGANMPALEVTAESARAVAKYTSAADSTGVVDFFFKIIPNSFVGAFTEGEILQVLFLAILCGLVLAKLGDSAADLTSLLHQASHLFFGIVGIITRAAPIAAFGAMAYTVGKNGLVALQSLGLLMVCVYITCALFVFVVLGLIARLHGFSLWRALCHIKEELLIVLGTSSSESALPGLMQKLRNAGCAESVVGIVVPAGYSFNLDGTSIYLTMATLFVAQATHTALTLGQELGILGILLITSKGAAAVTGGGFITLAATLKTTSIPPGGLNLLFGVDRFMSEARAITNLIGNTVATIVIAKWEGAFDAEKGAVLNAAPTPAHLPDH